MPIQRTLATSTQEWKDASLLALLENEKSIVLVFSQTKEEWGHVSHKKIPHKLAKPVSLYPWHRPVKSCPFRHIYSFQWKKLATVYNCLQGEKKKQLYTHCRHTASIYPQLSGKDIFVRTLLLIFKLYKQKTVLCWNQASLLVSSLNAWLKRSETHATYH